MKITDISLQAKNPNRVNVSVDGKYRFSFDVFQVGELGLKVGREFSEAELTAFEDESRFGKLYMQAAEYCMLRPHSAKEVRDYLWRKTRDRKVRLRQTGEVVDRAGVSVEITERVFERLVQKGYIDDAKFASWWVENRHLKKGISQRKLYNELLKKGVSSGIINLTLQGTERSEKIELRKIIDKKRSRYDDQQKLIAYLARQGFSYDDIKDALADVD